MPVSLNGSSRERSLSPGSAEGLKVSFTLPNCLFTLALVLCCQVYLPGDNFLCTYPFTSGVTARVSPSAAAPACAATRTGDVYRVYSLTLSHTRAHTQHSQTHVCMYACNTCTCLSMHVFIHTHVYIKQAPYQSAPYVAYSTPSAAPSAAQAECLKMSAS